MADLSAQKRMQLRKIFGGVGQASHMPNLIEVQKSSYESFLQMEKPEGGRAKIGLQSVFPSVFPIEDFSHRATLEFLDYEFEKPKYDVEECRHRGMTYEAPLKLTLRFIVFDVDPETGARSLKDSKEQPVYMGDIPLMTDNGTFVINGAERVVVSQMHRSPGVFFGDDRGKTHSSNKLLFLARIIPYRGSWLDFEFDSKDILHVRIDRRRKVPSTIMLYALGMTTEEILTYFHGALTYEKSKKGWLMPCLQENLRGQRAPHDLCNPKNGERLVTAGEKITGRVLRTITEKKLTALLVPFKELKERYPLKRCHGPQNGGSPCRGGRRN